MSGAGSALARARERFLGDGALDDGAPDERAAVRPEIADSWARSRRAGVDATRLSVPYESDLDLGGSLARCAAPVLDHLEEQLSGSLVAVVLTDPSGRLLDRRVGEGELRRRLDDISLAPGFSYAEEFAGTNGVGTALQGAAAALVVGEEHFTDRLQAFACAGAPVLHPLDRRLVGIVDLTCLREEANDLLRVLALQAARDIGLVLRERGSQGARALMAEFQAVCARSPHPVVAVGEDVLIANRTAQAALDGADHEQLRRRAAEYARTPAAAGHRVVLGAGPVRIRPITVVRAGLPVGVVLEIVADPGHPVLRAPRETSAASPRERGRPARTRVGLPGLAGSSGSWRATCSALRATAAGGAPTLVLGEAGTGKSVAVRAVHHEARAGARWVAVDGGDGVVAALDDLEGREPEALTVVVRHLERLTGPEIDAVAALIRRARDAPWWVVGLVTGETLDPACPAAELLGSFATTVVVEPLRHRAEDVPALVTSLLGRLAPARRVRCTPSVTALLAGALWPGNVSEVVDVLRHAIAARPTGDLEPDDLPPEFAAHGTRRRLSPLENAERDLIVRALHEAGGNRSRAAAALGIGRATLYRRLRAFGIGGVGR